MIETVRSEAGSSFLFFVFLAAGIWVVAVEYLYPELFRRDTRHLFYFSGLGSQQRNARSYTAYRILASLCCALVLALFFAVYLTRVYPFACTFSFSLVGTAFAVAAAFLLLRYALDGFLAWLFDVRMQVKDVLEKNVAFRQAFGVYGLAVLFVLTYSGLAPAVFTESALWWFAGLYLATYLASMAEYLVGKPEYIFYFIFYLCITEICPAIVAWSLFKRTLA